MDGNDRKVLWAGITVAAILAVEFAWFLFHPLDLKAEVWTAAATIATAAATIALTLSTVGLWRQTKRLAEGADDQSKKMADMIRATEKYAKATSDSAAAAEKALIVSDRPWIEIKAEISGPLAFEDDQIIATIDFTLTNIGKSPAAFVHLFAQLHTDSSAAQSYAQQTTRNHFSSALLGYGNILFPNASIQSERRVIGIKRADFIERIREIDQTPRSTEKDEPEREPFTHSYPGVSAIVFYVLPNDPKKRAKYTTLILDIKLGKPQPAAGGWLENGFDGSVGTFEQDALTLQQSFLSGEAS